VAWQNIKTNFLDSKLRELRPLKTGETPAMIDYEPPNPRLAAVRIVDLQRQTRLVAKARYSVISSMRTRDRFLPPTARSGRRYPKSRTM